MEAGYIIYTFYFRIVQGAFQIFVLKEAREIGSDSLRSNDIMVNGTAFTKQ